MVPRHLQQSRALLGGVAAAGEQFLEAAGQGRVGEIAVGGRHDQGGTRQDTQDLGHPPARLQHRQAAGGQMAVVGRAIAFGGEFRVEFRGGLAAAHGLDVGDKVEQVFDGRLVRGQPHCLRASERQAQGELGFRQPAVELVPEQPARHRLGRRLREKDAVPRHRHVVEPHLPIELVVAAAERRRERVGGARRGLAADHRHAGRVHRHDEGRTLALEIGAVYRADIDVLGEGGAGQHADLAADHDARAGLIDDPERRPLGGILAQPIADRRGTCGKGQEAAGARDLRAIGLGVGDLVRAAALPRPTACRTPSAIR